MSPVIFPKLFHAIAITALLAVSAGCSQADETAVAVSSDAQAVYDQLAAKAAGLHPVTPGFAVSPQINVADLQGIADAGFTRIINHLPDGESANQALSADIKAEAQKLGLKFVDLPFRPGHLSSQTFDALQAELAGSNEPTLSYCRSGTRAITIWAMAEVRAGRLTPDQAIAAASDAGYRLQGQKKKLEQLSKDTK
ncbi:hypothetical protein MNBD_ALPHA06-64 [hydrothermal vent metagenome]|uniref:Beta-lactamase hydrolase-like protein phosphatase-like domain-containing protein n=1 Tax=hydrothermal vent metagenome TaxID=652676 RepID=A0A3B0RTK6_9ZZZZ